MGIQVNLIGQRFGLLVVESCDGSDKNNKRRWKCHCDCGGSSSVTTSGLRGGHTKSCECRERIQHGMTGTPEHQAWMSMIGRCTNENGKGFANYGGRGISVCREWTDSFSAFLSYIGPRPSDEHSVDRIDTNGDYEPGNVRWATQLEQLQNVRKNVNIQIGGETHCAREWSRRSGLDHKVIISRFRRGVPENQLLSPTQ